MKNGTPIASSISVSLNFETMLWNKSTVLRLCFYYKGTGVAALNHRLGMLSRHITRSLASKIPVADWVIWKKDVIIVRPSVVLSIEALMVRKYLVQYLILIFNQGLSWTQSRTSWNNFQTFQHSLYDLGLAFPLRHNSVMFTWDWTSALTTFPPDNVEFLRFVSSCR